HEPILLRETRNETQGASDLHENGLPLPYWAGSPALVSGSHPDLVAFGEDLYAGVVTAVEAAGYTAGRYPDTSTPVSGAAVAAGAYHAVGLISEPLLRDWSQPGWVEIPFATRVHISHITVRTALDWHRANAPALAAARSASILYANTTTDPIQLTTTEMVDGAPLAVNVSGYTLAEPLPADLVTAHGITVDGSFVSVNQPARIAVAMLCDPESRDKVVTATRVLRPARVEIPPGDWVDTRVVIGGRKRRITSAWQVVNGARKPVRIRTRT
ncbi:MAG: hypothetical protein QJR09_07470, partial [Micrococcus sp.]|nr:hypothetical protein [Micrococcus sp.]